MELRGHFPGNISGQAMSRGSHRYQHPIAEVHRRKVKDLAKRLEEGMLKAAISKEDYMNLDTLETRLSNVLRRSSNNHNQQYPQLVSSSPIGTMIPTPGLSNGYQQSSTNFSIGSGGNMSSVGVQRNSSQMIPTPGFSVSNNHSYMNVGPSTNSSVFSGVDSTLVSQSQSQQQHQKLQVSGHTNHVLHNLGNQMGSGMRSGLLQKSFAHPNGSMNSGLGLIGNNIQHANEPGSDDFPSTYTNSPKHLQQHFDQNQQPIAQ
ncbi:histone acetyltransferase HAC1-like isoform X2, partial [Sesbania bispinosa]